MTEAQNRKLIKILSHYGKNHQAEKTVEECAELIQALAKDRESNARDMVIDEIADVYVMLAQLEIAYDCHGEVASRIDYKINRQMERMRQV